MNKLQKILDSHLFLTFISIIIGFIIGSLFLLFVNISPVVAYSKLFSSIFGSAKALSYCVVYGTPLILTGLAVAFAFKTGVFNIGAEGQFIVGSMAACIVGIFVEAPSYILVPLCFIAAAVAGALWGAIVGFLKVKWGINEVLSMIMFNWLAFYLSNYCVTLKAIHAEGAAEATKNVQKAAMILLPEGMRANLAPTANYGIIIAIIAAIVVYIIMDKTTLGYQLKAVGYNKNAAEYGGINVAKTILLTMAISGALAGIGGATQLLGPGQRISLFAGQEGYGFQGISVALIGASNPFGTILAGIFYGALKYGGTKLNLIHAPSEIINVIMGTVVFCIAISHVFKIHLKKKKDKKIVEAKGGKNNG